MYNFLLSWRKPSPLSLNVDPNHLFFKKAWHQECKLKIHQTIVANNFVILNTNQIKLYAYPNFLKENYLNLKGYY